jgi:hypothetical protein
LAGVALALPALERAAKLQRRAARTGFDWPDKAGPRAKIDEELAELVGKCVHVIVRDGVGDLIGFLDRVGRDGREALLAIPFATMIRIAQPAHDRDEAVDWTLSAHEGALRSGNPKV